MTKQSIAKLFVLAVGIAAVPSLSQAGTATAAKESKPVVEQVKESCITGDLGVNVVSQYISRGLIFENQGAIIQPYADLYFKLYESEGFLNKISLNLGIWNSFQSRKTDAGAVTGAGTASTRSWYEFDFTAGVSFTFAKNFTFTPSYYTFLSPNDGFATFQGLNLALGYDTTDLIGFNLAPKVQVLFELENKAGNGADEGIYYEIALAPSFPVGPVTISIPLTAGFGSNDFYAGDEGFGFASGGVQVSYNLPFIPECYGTWTVSAGATYYYLGSALENFNVPNVRSSNENEVIFNGGLMVAF
jgi:hypothetical protein